MLFTLAGILSETGFELVLKPILELVPKFVRGELGWAGQFCSKLSSAMLPPNWFTPCSPSKTSAPGLGSPSRDLPFVKHGVLSEQQISSHKTLFILFILCIILKQGVSLIKQNIHTLLNTQGSFVKHFV